jgi:hypothetical protein
VKFFAFYAIFRPGSVHARSRATFAEAKASLARTNFPLLFNSEARRLKARRRVARKRVRLAWTKKTRREARVARRARDAHAAPDAARAVRTDREMQTIR